MISWIRPVMRGFAYHQPVALFSANASQSPSNMICVPSVSILTQSMSSGSKDRNVTRCAYGFPFARVRFSNSTTASRNLLPSSVVMTSASEWSRPNPRDHRCLIECIPPVGPVNNSETLRSYRQSVSQCGGCPQLGASGSQRESDPVRRQSRPLTYWIGEFQ